MNSTSSNASSNASVKSDSSYHPVSPKSPAVKASNQRQKRISNVQRQTAKSTLNDFSLPPPPTRSRKIIQMKPTSSQETSRPLPPVSSSSASRRGTTTSTAQSKNKPSTTSVAGRKIARKTAHSLIERRRRSKMNEEFGVLKEMIPACRNQEMHKLAILQASIDYLRYLERCVTDLKAANENLPTQAPYDPKHQARSAIDGDDDDDDDDDDNEDPDLEMAETPSTTASPAITPLYSQTPSAFTYISTSIPLTPTHPTQSRSYPATSLPSPVFPPTSQSQFQSQIKTTYPSPNFENPHLTRPYSSSTAYSLSTTTSPALLPNVVSMELGLEDADHEATAALLMLNTERRDRGGKGRGMSVRDLLSS